MALALSSLACELFGSIELTAAQYLGIFDFLSTTKGVVLQQQFVPSPKFVTTKEFIDSALETTGLTVDELATRLDYKSLHRARYGEIPLPGSKRNHIADIVRLHELEAHGRPGEKEVTAPFDKPESDSLKQRQKVGASVKLCAAMNARGLNPSTFAKFLGCEVNVIENLLNGSGRISEEEATNICELLDREITLEDLIPSETPGASLHTPLSIPDGMNAKIIPIISWEAASLVSRRDGLHKAPISGAVVSTIEGRTFAVTICDHSMHPEINHGDQAVVRTDVSARPGQLVLLRTTHGDLHCKRASRRERERIVILSSVSTSYQPIEVPGSEISWMHPVRQLIRNY